MNLVFKCVFTIVAGTVYPKVVVLGLQKLIRVHWGEFGPTMAYWGLLRLTGSISMIQMVCNIVLYPVGKFSGKLQQWNNSKTPIIVAA